MAGGEEEEEDFGQERIIIKNLTDAIGFALQGRLMLNSNNNQIISIENRHGTAHSHLSTVFNKTTTTNNRRREKKLTI